MKTTALDVLACPRCYGDLLLRVRSQQGPEVIDGQLTCRACGAGYPVTRGVPRFVPGDAYARSFGRQWQWFRTVQLDSLSGAARSEDALRATTGWPDELYRGRRVLDAGAGAGRFAERAAAKGADVFGIDLTGAIDAAYSNIGTLDRVHLAQADIFALPFRPGTFDLAYSIGVLHHTPDTAAAFSRVAATVREGGRLAIYVYGRHAADRMSDLFRRVTTRLPLGVMWGLAAAAIPLYYLHRAPVAGPLMRFVLPISMESDWRWRWLDTFDWYTPTYQWKHTHPDVFRWFQDNGFEVVGLFDGPIRAAGIKRAATPTAAHDGILDDSRLVAS